MTGKELRIFLKKYDLTQVEFANLLGVTPMAVQHWLTDKRSVARPIGRLLRMFDRKPELMREFGK